MSVRQSAGHFAALDKASWNQFQNRYRLELFSIGSDWSLGMGGQSDNLRLHRMIYQETTANAVITCHPVEVYQLVQMKVDYRKLTILPATEVFNDFSVYNGEKQQGAQSYSKLLFSYRNGLTAWGKNLFEVVNQIDMLVFSAKLAILNRKV